MQEDRAKDIPLFPWVRGVILAMTGADAFLVLDYALGGVMETSAGGLAFALFVMISTLLPFAILYVLNHCSGNNRQAAAVLLATAGIGGFQLYVMFELANCPRDPFVLLGMIFFSFQQCFFCGIATLVWYFFKNRQKTIS